jgi:hypothetical protein
MAEVQTKTISKRIIQLMSRYLNVHRERAFEYRDNWDDLDTDEVDIDDIEEGIIDHTTINNDLDMKLECKLDDEMNRKLYFNLSTREEVSPHIFEYFNIFKFELKTKELDDEKLNKYLGKSYEKCVCGELVKIDGKCEKCYIFSYEHDENCCICGENDYRWNKLECGHILHNHCMRKMIRHSYYVDDKPAHRCPLCRHEIHYEKVKNDCFNI